MRWLGGKWRLAPWVIEHFPAHRIYVEPFGGAGSVLLRKERAYNETWNDLDGELVNLFHVLRGPDAGELLRRLYLTPYSRAEYLAAFAPCDEPIERARRMLIRSHLAHGTGGARVDRQTGFRSDGRSATTNVAGEWAKLPDALWLTVERLRGVNLEQVSAFDLIERYNDPKALLYLDPPYVSDTRSAKSKQGGGYHTYAHELDDAAHVRLCELIRASRAMIVLSGYPNPIYDSLLADWQVADRAARAHRNALRTERLWLNPAVAEALANA